MTPSAFTRLAAAIAAANDVSRETAEDWLVLIGDTPEFTADGRVIIPDDLGNPTATTIVWPAES